MQDAFVYSVGEEDLQRAEDGDQMPRFSYTDCCRRFLVCAGPVRRMSRTWTERQLGLMEIDESALAS